MEAASKVCEQLEDVTINIVGKPIPGYSLPSLSVLPNGGRINLVKQYVSPGDLVQFFNKAVCVICPYIDATQSGVVLTAYAFDRPVIASRVGGLPEYVLDGHTGLLIEPNDSQALADAILLMLQNNELRRNLQQGCSDVQQEYISWERISNQYIHIFRNLTQDG